MNKIEPKTAPSSSALSRRPILVWILYLLHLCLIPWVIWYIAAVFHIVPVDANMALALKQHSWLSKASSVIVVVFSILGTHRLFFRQHRAALIYLCAPGFYALQKTAIFIKYCLHQSCPPVTFFNSVVINVLIMLAIASIIALMTKYWPPMNSHSLERNIIPQEQRAEFKNPTNLTKWTKIFLYVQVIISIIAIASSTLEYQLLSDFKSGVYTSQELAVEAGKESDARQHVVGIAQFIIFIVLWILILKWIYRANYNARQLGATGMTFTPGWSIGWYFVPIINLWKPYQAMKEIWKTSSDPLNWKTQSVSSILSWWWLFWITCGIAANISFRMTMRAEEIDEFIAANIITQVSDVIGISLNLITIAIISRVYKMQMTHTSVEKSI